MFKYLMHPPAEMPRGRYLRRAVATVTLLSVGLSVAVTVGLEILTPQPDFARGLFVAVSVPLCLVPFLSYWHSKVLFELETAKRRIEDLSRTDALTGLNNRRHFFDTAEQMLALARRHGHPVTALLLDLDHFKAVNDRFGHLAGDEVLRRTAATLASVVRGTDLLARYGGEEFVLLLPHTAGAEALRFCGRLRDQLAETWRAAADGLPQVTVSIGAACSQEHGLELGPLLAAADQALYQAKEQGRDGAVLAA
ncbi:MAG: GGDEF domain-containing protein [Deltaproteobacteria bacterium]|nr:GGDEF domain-containing protein [Deltaproteobacteria bacterium]